MHCLYVVYKLYVDSMIVLSLLLASISEYSYDNFNFEEDEDVVGDDLVQQREPSQADYERVLLENLTSSEDEDDLPKPAKRKKTTPGR